MELRPYQTKLRLLSDYHAAQGKRRQLLFLPTGGGKTVVAADLIHRAYAAGRRSLFVVRQEPLIAQTISKLAAFGVDCGVIKAGYTADLSHETQVATVQTMNRRSLFPPADLVILDEAHGATAAQYDAIFERYSDALILGLTATPFRTKRVESLDARFDVLVGDYQTRDLVAEGFLVPPTVFGWPADALDLSKTRVSAGDYNIGDLAIAVNTPVMVRSAVAEYIRRGAGKRALAFCVTLAHAEAFADALRAAGIPAETVTGETPPAERQAIYARLRTLETHVIASVGVLSEGFDEPSAEVALMLRPTKSRSLYLQQAGRVLRLSAATGKTRALILDQAGNVWRHGLPTDPIELSLRAAPIDSTADREAPVKRCEECGAINAAGAARCAECGAAFPIRDGKAAKVLTGALAEVDAAELLDERLRHWRSVADVRNYKRGWIVMAFLQAYPRPTLEQLRAVRAAVGYKRGWERHIYAKIHDELPALAEA